MLYTEKFMFLEIVLFVFLFLVAKLLLQRWISSLFDLSDFSRDYIFSRIAYSSYAAIVMIIFLFLKTLVFTSFSVIYDTTDYQHIKLA